MSVDPSWFSRLAAQHGPFPHSFLSIDTETSGLSADSGDVILEVGFCRVENGVVAETGSTILDWTKAPNVSSAWLRKRLDQTRQSFADKGKPYPWSLEKLAQAGSDPLDVLADFLVLIENYAADGGAVVGHNLIGFDKGFLEKSWRRALYHDGEVFGENLWDTAAYCKSCQLGWHPEKTETLKTFSERVLRRPMKGIKYSLDTWAVPAFELKSKYALDVAKAHTAGFDSLVAAYLLLEMKKMAETATAGKPPALTANAKG